MSEDWRSPCSTACGRASAVDGNHLAAWRAEAERSAAACADADDRNAVLADLATIPT